MREFYSFSRLTLTKMAVSILLGSGLAYLSSQNAFAQNSSSQTVFQEEIEISGIIQDQAGLPVPGASVLELGTQNGTSTDIDGLFSLKVKKGSTIQVSFIGYKSIEIKVTSTKKMTISLEEDARLLDDVVVVGYGAVKKSDLTSSISTVKGREVQKISTGNALNALQGKVTGVQISTSSGAPGSTPRIIIRGVTSQNGHEPLYVVDGMPGVQINSIPTSDILSIEILKDAAATSIYGSRGSNGVILITTKKGSKNTPIKFSVNVKQGFQTMEKPKMADAEEYMEVYKARFENDGLAYLPFENPANTDWWDELIRPVALSGDYGISFDGGSDKVIYSGGLNYYRQNAQTKDKGYWQRLSGRINIEYNVNDWFKFGTEMSPRFESTENYYGGAFQGAMEYDPTLTPLLSEEERVGKDIYDIYSHSLHTSVWNPAAAAARSNGGNTWFGMRSNSFIQFTPIKGLVFRSQFGLDFLHSEANWFNPKFNLGSPEESKVNSVHSNFSRNFNWVWNTTLNYMTSIKKHNITAMLGYVMEEQNSVWLQGSAEGIPNNYNEALRYISVAQKNPQVSGLAGSASLMSFLARFMYNYDSRYYLTATYRMDGSSKFVAANKFAHFPSVSAAWNLKNESWLKDVSWLSALKLRASWGMVGNQNIPSGAYLDKIEPAISVLNNQPAFGSYVSALANRNIKWEVVEDYNIGIDFGFADRVNFSAEYFNKTSHDMLMQASNLLITGLPMKNASMWTNIGSMRAKGFEFSAGVSDYTKALKYDVNFNISLVKNTAESLVDHAPQFGGSFSGSYTHKTVEGEEIGRFFLYETDGLFKSQDEVDAYITEEGDLIQPLAQPGDLKFVDQNNDGKIDDQDRVFVGSSLPKGIFGLNAYLEYKGFDFTININGQFGNKIFNAMKQRYDNGYAGVNVRKGLFNEVWTPENVNAKIPRLSEKDFNGNYLKPSTHFLENGSYAKISNIQIGYTFKMPKFYNMSLRIFASAQNVATITKYSGFDPEVASAGGNILGSGVDWFPYAQPRTFIVGLNFNF